MKKVLVSVLVAILIGGIFAVVFYNRIMANEKAVSSIIDNTCYAIQLGVFNNLDNANKIKDKYNGIIVIDEDKYRVYGAIAKSSNALSILKNYFNDMKVSYYVKQINVPDSLIDIINNSETLLVSSTSDTYPLIINNLLKEYEKLLI